MVILPSVKFGREAMLIFPIDSTSANQLCVTELLTNIQSAVGTLSIANIVQIIPNIASGSATIPKNVTCSDCVKQAYNIVNKDFPGSIPSQAASELSSACGSSFTGEFLTI